MHANLDKSRHDPARTLDAVAQIAAATLGNETEVAQVGGKPLTVSDLGQMLAAVTSIQGTHDQVVGYRRAMDDVLYALGWALHAFGVPQGRVGPAPAGGGPNRAQRRAAKRR